jgi:signal transduction histidine kinase
LDEKSREKFQERTRKVLAGEPIDESINYRVLGKNGREIWAALNVKLLHTDGKFDGALIVAQDVTEHKKVEDVLREAKESLEINVLERTAELLQAKKNLESINIELNKEIDKHKRTEAKLVKSKEAAEAAANAKAAFLANMSHELRTPMNSVIGFTSLLLDDNITTEQREYIEGIRNGGEALLALVNDILEFSKADKDKIELERQPISLRHCIEEALDMVATEANQKGLNLAYTVSYGTPDSIMGDHGRLRQILVNLLGNAVKFTDQGGISVSVSAKRKGNKSLINFSVSDTGIGISKNNLNKIFDPFAQVEHVISRKRDGVGLGLVISRKLVELMGGKIWAESKSGQGSIFHFNILTDTQPKVDLSDKQSQMDSVESHAVLKPLSILVAEDNPSNKKILVDMLKRMGYRPDAVSDGKEVLDALEQRPFDLILMDIKMPVMDGITATREIRSRWPEKGPTIIAVTAYALEGDREMCLKAGMDDYLAKPVLKKDLVNILNKFQ